MDDPIGLEETQVSEVFKLIKRIRQLFLLGYAEAVAGMSAVGELADFCLPEEFAVSRGCCRDEQVVILRGVYTCLPNHP